MTREEFLGYMKIISKNPENYGDLDFNILYASSQIPDHENINTNKYPDLNSNKIEIDKIIRDSEYNIPHDFTTLGYRKKHRYFALLLANKHRNYKVVDKMAPSIANYYVPFSNYEINGSKEPSGFDNNPSEIYNSHPIPKNPYNDVNYQDQINKYYNAPRINPNNIDRFHNKNYIRDNENDYLLNAIKSSFNSIDSINHPHLTQESELREARSTLNRLNNQRYSKTKPIRPIVLITNLLVPYENSKDEYYAPYKITRSIDRFNKDKEKINSKFSSYFQNSHHPLMDYYNNSLSKEYPNHSFITLGTNSQNKEINEGLLLNQNKIDFGPIKNNPRLGSLKLNDRILPTIILTDMEKRAHQIGNIKNITLLGNNKFRQFNGRPKINVDDILSGRSGVVTKLSYVFFNNTLPQETIAFFKDSRPSQAAFNQYNDQVMDLTTFQNQDIYKSINNNHQEKKIDDDEDIPKNIKLLPESYKKFRSIRPKYYPIISKNKPKSMKNVNSNTFE
ncbi:unnamed protein product [Gordionus sp. m RMFG-2023]